MTWYRISAFMNQPEAYVFRANASSALSAYKNIPGIKANFKRAGTLPTITPLSEAASRELEDSITSRDLPLEAIKKRWYFHKN